MPIYVCAYATDRGFSTFILSFTPWQILKVKFTSQIFFVFTLLQMPIVCKIVNFLLPKFTPKAGQIYPQGVNLPTVENPAKGSWWLFVIVAMQMRVMAPTVFTT